MVTTARAIEREYNDGLDNLEEQLVYAAEEEEEEEEDALDDSGAAQPG